MDRSVKTVFFWLVIVISAMLMWEVVRGARDGIRDKEENFTQFMADVDAGHVHDVTIDGMQVRGMFNDGSSFHTTAPANYPDMIKKLSDRGVVITIRDVRSGSTPLQLLETWAPLLFIAALWYAMIRRRPPRNPPPPPGPGTIDPTSGLR